jgi:hypothetical protein
MRVIPDVRTIGGVRTFERVTIRNAAIAGYIDLSPPSPSLSPDKGSPLRAGPCRNCVRELRPGVVRLDHQHALSRLRSP